MHESFNISFPCPPLMHPVDYRYLNYSLQVCCWEFNILISWFFWSYVDHQIFTGLEYYKFYTSIMIQNKLLRIESIIYYIGLYYIGSCRIQR